MQDIDKMIREALAEEEAQSLERVGGQQSQLQQALGVLHSSERWISALAIGAQICFLIFAVYALFSFFQTPADELKNLLTWGGGVFVALLWVAMLKMWFWMAMNKNAVTREVKRLELQVAFLSQRLEEGEAGDQP